MGRWESFQEAQGINWHPRPVCEINLTGRMSNGAAEAHHGIAFSDDGAKNVVLQITVGMNKEQVRGALLNALDIIDKQWATLIEDPALAFVGQLPTVAELCGKGAA